MLLSNDFDSGSEVANCQICEDQFFEAFYSK